jgi:hypothetical protein
MDDLTEIERARLDTEWALVVASREVLNIALRRDDPTTYRQALNFGAAIAPSVLAYERRVLHGIRESEQARFYAEMADAETKETGNVVTRLEIIEREIEDYEGKINALPNVNLMKRKLAKLELVRQEVKPKKYTENQLILRDAIKVERLLPVTKEGAEYREFQLDSQRILRICALHPDPPEHKIGADLIYEFHNLEEKTVRVALVQYKLWENDSLHQSGRMQSPIDKMKAIGCGGILCKSPYTMDDRLPYRFPHCAIFLRPTDPLQNRNATLITSGLHVPICVVNESWDTNSKGGQSLRRAKVESQSVSHRIFEDLFYNNFIGSNKFPVEQLELLYRKTGILDNKESIILHAQEYAIKPENPTARRRK